MPKTDGYGGNDDHASDFFEGIRTLLGDRYAGARYDPDRSLRITAIDPTDDDRTAIDALARWLDIRHPAHIERADPETLQAWERLRHDLRRLRENRPGLLRSYPTPGPGYQRPPVRIKLSATAEIVAADLHNRYGAFVSLEVGALPYPPQPEHPPAATSKIERATADPREMTIGLDGPLSIRSGHRTTHPLLLTNHTQHDITVGTNGHLTATIVDPTTGATVGGNSGWQSQPYVPFTATPGHTVAIPLLVATDSFDPTLGYTVPAGTWHLTTPLNLTEPPGLVTPPLDLTITD